MPDIVVHNSMGDKVLESLDAGISASIDKDIFHFALMVPDAYSYYRVFARPFRKDIHKRSVSIHEEHINDFFVRLAQDSGDQHVFSFLSGMLCHFALDSTTHPFINDLSDNKPEKHLAIEHRLDVLELERQGKPRKAIMTLLPKYIDLEEVQRAFLDIYGWDDNLLKVSYRHMKWFYRMAKDQTGLLNLLLHRTQGALSAVSYSNHICDGMDFDWFPPLEEQAMEYGVQLISSVFDYRMGKVPLDDFKEKLGDKNYGGEVS